ncbi:MAG TPA: hypothetical protein PK156_43745 [Polyangium sp.]|nr:hypothetical protein [Polyangium sp.]
MHAKPGGGHYVTGSLGFAGRSKTYMVGRFYRFIGWQEKRQRTPTNFACGLDDGRIAPKSRVDGKELTFDKRSVHGHLNHVPAPRAAERLQRGAGHDEPRQHPAPQDGIAVNGIPS